MKNMPVINELKDHIGSIEFWSVNLKGITDLVYILMKYDMENGLLKL